MSELDDFVDMSVQIAREFRERNKYSADHLVMVMVPEPLRVQVDDGVRARLAEHFLIIDDERAVYERDVFSREVPDGWCAP